MTDQKKRSEFADETLISRLTLEVEKLRADMNLQYQKVKISEQKYNEFQEEVYKTVQNLNKEMNEAFNILHNNFNKHSGITLPTSKEDLEEVQD